MSEGILTLGEGVDPLQVLTFCYLRGIRFLEDRRPLDRVKHPRIGMIFCRDGRTQQDEQQTSEGIQINPYPLYGSTVRFSPDCPEMPDSKLGFKGSPNAIHCQVQIEALRTGIGKFKFRFLKAGIHANWVQDELGCSWGIDLGLGLYQMCRLGIDGRATLKARSNREEWVKGGELEIMSPLHLTAMVDGQRTNLITVMNPHHPIVAKHNMATVMGIMSDQRFLEIEAPHLLEEYRRDPTCLVRLWQEAHLIAA